MCMKQHMHMSTYELYNIFGGYDRINRLNIHFENLLSQHQTPMDPNDNNNIQIALISRNKSSIVIEALKRVKLYQFFSDSIIIGSDNWESINQNRNIYDDIIKIKDKCKIFHKYNVLYVDNISLMSKQFSNQLSTQVIIFYPLKDNNNKILRGLSFTDFDHIECMVNNKRYIPINININQSLVNINDKVYFALSKEIINMNSNESIQSLPAIKWINNNLTMYSNAFITFAQYFRQVVGYMRNEDMWQAAQTLSELIINEPNDGYLYCRYAKCLSYLRHIKHADYYFNEAINFCQYKPLVRLLIGYGYHLLSIKYYYKAYIQFNKCLGMRINNSNCKLFVGLARSLQYLNNYEECENWYKRAIEFEIHWIGFYEKAHVHYAEFLKINNRLNDAIYHLQLCIENNPCQAMTHYKIAQIFHKMGELQQYEKHLNKALEIDPYLSRARIDYLEYYNKGYYDDVFYNNNNGNGNGNGNDDTNEMKYEYEYETKRNDEIKENIIEFNIYEDEFNRFWVEGLEMINEPRYKRYYDTMIELKWNDIRFLLFNDDIDNIIKNKIGITIDYDIKMILDKIKSEKKECIKFDKWLKKWELSSIFNPMFEIHTIYTI
eukprot:185158_1